MGYYHFCNGIDFSEGVRNIEEYLLGSIGLVKRDGLYFRGPNCLVSSTGSTHDKPALLTLCTYNIFARAELRTRISVVVPKGNNPSSKSGKYFKSKNPVLINTNYTIYYTAENRTVDYTSASVDEIDVQFWTELAALSLIRAIMSIDDPSVQLCGTVNLPDMVIDLLKLRKSAAALVVLLPRGYMAGTKGAYGTATFAGHGSGLLLKLTTYRNHLIDTLVRVVSMDLSGCAAYQAMTLILERYDHDFDYVICQLLKTQRTHNNTLEFLALLRDFFKLESLLCQAALLLTEQCRYLIGQGSIANAKYLAARAVAILPLDFDSWYHLALCYVLERDFIKAIDTINMLCVTGGGPGAPNTNAPNHAYEVLGALDTYASRWAEHASAGRSIDLRTFESYFRPPVDADDREIAAMQQIWHKLFQYYPQSRRPCAGVFHTSPLELASPREASAVNHEIQEVMGPNSATIRTAAKSARHPRASVLDYEHRSTWGRAYDLVTMIVALIGWDNLRETIQEAFDEDSMDTLDEIDPKGGLSILNEGPNLLHRDEDQEQLYKKPMCVWLLHLLTVIYDDLHAMTLLSGSEHRTALAWNMIGFAGWGCKYNLRETMSAFLTSASSTTEGRFDYFGTVKLLQIYNEFVLSDVTSSGLDLYVSTGNGKYTNKLIVKFYSPQVYEDFVKLLVNSAFTLENVLLYVVKLCSYSVRWYAYLPPCIIYETLLRLCVKYEPVVVRETLRILFVKFHKGKEKLSAALSLREMFAPPKTHERLNFEFEDSDTVLQYMSELLDWIESHNCVNK